MATNADERESGGIPIAITGTSEVIGPFCRVLVTGSSTTISTTGLTNNFSTLAVPTGATVSFGSELAASITLGAGAVIAYKLG